jgi:uncharacterized protein (TIGR00369 family)
MDLASLTRALLDLSPAQRAEAIQALSGGFDRTVGLRLVSCAPEEVVAELEVTAAHTQPYGLVHGGVYCTLVEAVGSCGAALHALPQGLLPVGVQNQTRFRRAARAGATLRAVGRPDPERAGAWVVDIHDEQGLCATGRLQTHALEPGAEVGGAAVELPEAAVAAAQGSRDDG